MPGETDRQHFSVSSGGSVSGGLPQINDAIAKPEVNCFIYGFASKFLATSLFMFHVVFIILTEIVIYTFLTTWCSSS